MAELVPSRLASGVAGEQKFGADRALDAGTAAFGATDQFVAHAGGPDAANFFGAEFAQSGALHLVEFNWNAHEHSSKRDDFYGGVPAIEVVGRIVFRNAESLSATNRFFKG
jgi:hypothetical protein